METLIYLTIGITLPITAPWLYAVLKESYTHWVCKKYSREEERVEWDEEVARINKHIVKHHTPKKDH